MDRKSLTADVAPVDILKFKDLKKYRDRLAAAQKATGEKDALIVVRGTVQGTKVVVAAFEFGFIGGSMGAVVGEKFTQAVNACVRDKVPLICFSTSGGARMQEALISLMQMAKTAAALARLRSMQIPFVSVLVDPVYGGVSASLAMMGDVNIAEPNALVGFTGPDVIRQTVRVKLPEGFQRSEFLLDHGAIDMIVHRNEMRTRINSLINKLMGRPEKILPEPEPETDIDTEVTEESSLIDMAGLPESAELAPESDMDNVVQDDEQILNDEEKSDEPDREEVAIEGSESDEAVEDLSEAGAREPQSEEETEAVAEQATIEGFCNCKRQPARIRAR